MLYGKASNTILRNLKLVLTSEGWAIISGKDGWGGWGGGGGGLQNWKGWGQKGAQKKSISHP